MQGWIRLHRQILYNPLVCKDSDYFSVWCYLLLKATHTNMDTFFAGKKISLKPGQLITGRKVISDKFNISESKVQRVLKMLEIEQQIEQQTCNLNRLITVINWVDYQITEQQNEQPVNNKRTTSEQPVNTYNNDNNDNNVNKINIEFDVFWNLYDKKIGSKEKLVKKWIKLTDNERKKIIDYIPEYKKTQPEKKFRKNPETFLNNKSWNDELINKTSNTNLSLTERAKLLWND